uniref:BY PROTMAP: gi/342320884/gb/EGU12822.1/ NADP-dependent alcohol dehydrogenase [Rhodotorula glutinis ATCC 204091] n=1 Tax=Rhodotorula toruloides TaxID=5286 RepID=A0A0K3CCX8_RHOTO
MRGRGETRRGGASLGQAAQARKEREQERKAQAKLRKEREQERKHKAAERQKEQREKARVQAQRQKDKASAERNKLRSSLKPPKRVTNKWQIFVNEFIQVRAGVPFVSGASTSLTRRSSSHAQERKRSLPAGSKMPTITTLVPEAKAKYAQLSSSELSALDQRVDQARADYERQLAEWQKTLTPEMIREENLVRYRRRRAGLSRKANLHIPGEPKRPMTPFFRFCTEVRERQDRDVLGDETAITEQSKLLARAWKALSPEQKKIHTLTNGWPRPTSYPCIAGHEVVGTIVRAGSRTSHKVGTRVGVGAQGGSCLECDFCKQGLQQHCDKGMIGTYQGIWEDGSVAQGGYADFMRCRGALAVPIPDGLESESTAPLLCAGVTVYAPLKRFNAGPGKRVGVIGIGGLGHLALQIAKAMGADVYALSHSASKMDDAEKLGCPRENFIVAKDQAEVRKKYNKHFDVSFCTVSFDGDRQWVLTNGTGAQILILTSSANDIPLEGLYLPLLRNMGTFIICALPEEKLPAMYGQMLVGKSLNLAGSLIGGSSEISELFDLALKHDIKAWVETRPMSEATQAAQDMHAGKSRYRYVLKN